KALSFARSARPPAGVILALGLLCAPSEAWAGCGDYVLVGGSAAHAAQPGPHRSPARIPSHPTSHGPAKGPTPCSGPLCSRPPASPPVTTPPTAPERGPEWGVIALLALGTVPEPRADLIDGPPLRPVRRVPTVYHPPR